MINNQETNIIGQAPEHFWNAGFTTGIDARNGWLFFD